MKTALITGASRGIGKAIALHFAQHQYNIIITCNKNHVLLNEVAQEIRSYQVRCFTFVGDCSQSHNIKKLFQMISKEFSSLDVVVNNIGVSHIGLLQDMTDEAWDSLYRSNVSSMFYTCRECIPLMLSQSNGSIINISSIWGKVGASCEVAYSTTKGAMNAFTRSLAKELAPSNISVNAIACGLIDTEMNAHLSNEEYRELESDIPAGRAGRPEEVASSVYALTLQSKYLTGQIICLDGGWI